MSDWLSLLNEHAGLVTKLRDQQEAVERMADLLIEAFRAGKKLLICGNGGSAADAQHMAAELTGRFRRERRGLPAIALTVDTSALTAIGNDYGFGRVFARQVEALGRPGDFLLAISTSGNSTNVLEAARVAHRADMRVIGLTGESGGQLSRLCSACLCVPHSTTERIQEAHQLAYHYLCRRVEDAFAK